MDNKKKTREDFNNTGSIGLIFHFIIGLVALYLSFKCNDGFDLGSFLIACCCPYIYIIYVLSTKQNMCM